MTRRLRSMLILPVASVLLLAGCGSSDGQSEEAKPYVDAMSKSMSEGEDSPVSEEEGRCFSEKMIDVVGIDKVKEAGTPEEFASGGDSMDFEKLEITREQGEEIYDNFDACGVDMREEFMKSMESDGEMDAATKECLDEAFTDDKLKDFFVTIMVDGESALEETEVGKDLMGDMMACMMGQMGEEPSTE